jgi:hypothetical protein
MTSITASTQSTTDNKLFIENYKILQNSPESDTKLSHNFHTVDLVTGKLKNVALKELLLALNIDRSGSMVSQAKDGYTALQHTIHTAKNIIGYLEELKEDNPELNLNLLINLFDDKNTMIGLYEIGQKSEEVKKEYIKKLEKVEPRGATNISGAFEKIKENTVYSSTPNEKKAHILMTDGRPNDGKTSAEGIIENNPAGNQIVIGYGTGHDAVLLQKMAELSKGSYHFVDSIENAGMVYGEIIHGLLYAAVKNISVVIKGAEVYDFTTNTWTNKISFNTFASEHTQSLIMRNSWDTVEPISFNIVYTETGNNVKHSKTEVFNSYNCTNGESKETSRSIDVEKQMFRQKTLDALFKAKSTLLEAEKELLEKNLLELQKELKEFMKRNKLEDDAFMQKLVTDVYVAYTGINSHNGAAFINSRRTTQGYQRAYDVNNFDGLTRNMDLGNALFGAPASVLGASMGNSMGLDISKRCNYRRASAPCSAPMPMMSAPTMTGRQTSCYTTPTQAMAMRSCSQQPLVEDSDDE